MASMTSLRTCCLAAALLVAACAHQPPAPRERIVPPPAASEQAGTPPADAANSATGAPPSLTMPREWQHHNGEDYDDWFDRMRAGFAFDEVQEPAINKSLACVQHNPDYIDRWFPRRT